MKHLMKGFLVFLIYLVAMACSDTEKAPEAASTNSNAAFYLKNQMRINDSVTKAELWIQHDGNHLKISDSLSSGLSDLPKSEWAEMKIPQQALTAATLFGESDDYIYAMPIAGKLHVWMGKIVQGPNEGEMIAAYDEIFVER